MRIFKNFCVAFLRGYQLLLSPLLFSLGVRCRFFPSCSQYAIEAVNIFGPLKGTSLALVRLLKCQPFCRGGHDPVPMGPRLENHNG